VDAQASQASYAEDASRVTLPPNAPSVRVTAGVGSASQKTWNLRRPVAMVGSRRTALLHLDSPEVSKAHCLIVNTGTDVLLRDLASHSGTFCGDQRVELTALADGSVVRVGSTHIQVAIQAASQGNDDTETDYEYMDPTRMPKPVVLTDAEGNRHKLERSVSVVGRREECDLILSDLDVSLAHAAIVHVQGRPAVYDLGSRNGTFVNEKRVSLAYIAPGDKLALGPCQFTVANGDPESQTVEQDASAAGENEQTAPAPSDHESDNAQATADDAERDTTSEQSSHQAPEAAEEAPATDQVEPAQTNDEPTQQEQQEGDMSAVDQLPHELQGKIASLQDNIRTWWDQLQEWQGRLEQYGQQLHQRTNDLTEREQQLAARQEEVQNRQQQTEDQQGELEKARNDFEAHRATFEEEHLKLEQAKAAVRTQQDELTQRRQEVEAEHEQTAQKQQQIETQREELDKRDNDLRQREGQLAERQQQLDQQAADLDAREQAITQQQSALNQLQSALDETNRTITESLGQRMAAITDMIDSIGQSSAQTKDIDEQSEPAPAATSESSSTPDESTQDQAPSEQETASEPTAQQDGNQDPSTDQPQADSPEQPAMHTFSMDLDPETADKLRMLRRLHNDQKSDEELMEQILAEQRTDGSGDQDRKKRNWWFAGSSS